MREELNHRLHRLHRFRKGGKTVTGMDFPIQRRSRQRAEALIGAESPRRPESPPEQHFPTSRNLCHLCNLWLGSSAFLFKAPRVLPPRESQFVTRV